MIKAFFEREVKRLNYVQMRKVFRVKEKVEFEAMIAEAQAKSVSKKDEKDQNEEIHVPNESKQEKSPEEDWESDYQKLMESFENPPVEI